MTIAIDLDISSGSVARSLCPSVPTSYGLAFDGQISERAVRGGVAAI